MNTSPVLRQISLVLTGIVVGLAAGTMISGHLMTVKANAELSHRYDFLQHCLLRSAEAKTGRLIPGN